MARVVPPRERTCERCGRADVWDPDVGTWVVDGDPEENAGSPHCVHEWDITGNYKPVEE